MRILPFFWVLLLVVGMPLHGSAASSDPQDRSAEESSDEDGELRWSFERGASLETPAGTRLLGIHVGISPGLLISSIKEPEKRRLSVGLPLSRLRIQLNGTPIPLRLGYAVSLAFDQGTLSLKDVWLDASLGSPALWLRAGQLRRAFSRQGLTPYHRMVLPDRPLTEQVFESGHDPGLMFHGGPWGSFEWALAFLMGEYQSPSRVGESLRRELLTNDAPPPRAGSILLRLARRSKQGPSYNESDVRKRPFRWSVGMSVQTFLTDEDQARGALQSEVDLHIAARGWTLIGAFFVATEQEGKSFENQAFQAAGYTLQTSYLIGASWEPSLRFTHLVFPGADTDVKDISTGLSFSLYGGMLRWLNRLGMVTRDIEGGYRSDLVFKSHLQFRY